MTGFVYAMLDAQGRVKIGWSGNPRKRRNEIAVANPGVQLVGIITATKAQEDEAHQLLVSERIAGDWFHHKGIVATFVGMLPKPRSRVMALLEQGAHPLRIWRVQQGLTLLELAANTGLSTGALSGFENRKIAPTGQTIRRLMAATGLPAEAFLPEIAA